MAGGRSEPFLQLGEAYGLFIPPLRRHREIMEVLLEFFVFFEREDDRDPLTLLIDHVAFHRVHGQHPVPYI
jgi:hypothetical protein